MSRIRPGQSRDPAFETAGKRPEDLTYAHGRVYVASRFDDTLVILDADTMKPVRKPLPLPLNPFAVTSDRRHVWVAGLGYDTVTRSPAWICADAGRQSSPRRTMPRSTASAASAARFWFWGSDSSPNSSNSRPSVPLTVSTERKSCSAMSRLDAGAA